MDRNWTKVFVSTQEYQVMMLQDVLEENGIDCVTINKKDSAYLFGEVELYVKKDQVLLANQIIKSQIEGE